MTVNFLPQMLSEYTLGRVERLDRDQCMTKRGGEQVHNPRRVHSPSFRRNGEQSEEMAQKGNPVRSNRRH